MVVRRPAGSDWPGRFLPLVVSTLLGLCSTGLVFYFSSQRAQLDSLQAQVSANSGRIDLLKQQVEMNKSRRDEQIADIMARLEHRR